MNTKLTIAGVLVANIIVLWCLAHHYQFHTGEGGRIMWRCNNFTGKVEYSFTETGRWVPISYPTPNPTWEETTPLPNATENSKTNSKAVQTNKTMTAEQFLDTK